MYRVNGVSYSEEQLLEIANGWLRPTGWVEALDNEKRENETLDFVYNSDEEVPVKTDAKVENLFKTLDDLTSAKLREELLAVKIEPHGTKKQMRKRLRGFYRKDFHDMLANLDKEKAGRQRYKYLLVIDVEATCDEDTLLSVEEQINYPHEIIELPAVLVDVKTATIKDKFRTFVRPEIRPKLTLFCTQLTGISQETVDSAPLFPEAFELLQQWAGSHNLFAHSFAIVTDGPNDIQHFLQRSFLQYRMPIPPEFRKWINIKTPYVQNVRRIPIGVLRDGRKVSGIEHMLAGLHLRMEGINHSGSIPRAVDRMPYTKKDVTYRELLEMEATGMYDTDESEGN